MPYEVLLKELNIKIVAFLSTGLLTQQFLFLWLIF